MGGACRATDNLDSRPLARRFGLLALAVGGVVGLGLPAVAWVTGTRAPLGLGDPGRAVLLVGAGSVVLGALLALAVYRQPLGVSRRFEARIADLHAAKARVQEQSQARLAHMKRLAELSHLVSSSLDVQRVLDFVAEAALDFLDGDLVRIWINEDNGLLRLGAMKGRGGEGTAPVEAALPAPDPIADPLGLNRGVTDIDGFVSQISTPLVAGERFLGALVVLTRTFREFTDEQQELLQIFAGKVAAALDNARLYEATRRVMAELQGKNAELDSFVYSVSHDLKAPLVAIQGMAGAVLEDYGDTLDAQGRRYLERLEANVHQMERLIQDLLALSRVGRESRAPEPISLNELVDELLMDLQAQIEARGVKVTVGDLATVRAIRAEVTQVMANLLTNAVKYLGDTPTPMVEVGTVDQGAMVACYVRDNGIGIAPEYHEKVFEIFQRLKDVEAEGTGVGLAIVKKIVERAGGRVWVESVKGQGATFWFTWPQGRERDAAA